MIDICKFILLGSKKELIRSFLDYLVLGFGSFVPSEPLA